MNNIVNRALEHASENYEVSIVLDESGAFLLPELKCPGNVSMKIEKTLSGTYLKLEGDAENIMKLEVELYELLSRNYAYTINNKGMASTETI